MDFQGLLLVVFGIALIIAAPTIADLYLRYYNGPWPRERARHFQIIASRVAGTVLCVFGVLWFAK